MKHLSLPLLLCITCLSMSQFAKAAGPDPIPLWPDGAPGAKGDEAADHPEIRIYAADDSKATGAAVVILPGGGYGALATDHEGHQIAQWFNTIGVTGVVVKYRLGPRYHHPAPLQDAQRAIRYTRAHAKELNIDPQRIGVMGFSAGGHLASTASTHFDDGDANSEDPVAQQGSRPDFSILCYPVISLRSEFGHKGSLRNLLGENPDPELVESLSSETQVTKNTPPAFLFHTDGDRGVPVENSLVYYQALRKHGVPAELHVYQVGPHGVGLAPGNPVLSTWKERLADWLKVNGFLATKKRAAVSGTVTVGGEPLRWGTIAFVPSGAEQSPVAWGMVSRGRFALNATQGPAEGTSHVEIRSLGSVEPEPTIESVRLVSGPETAVQVEVLSEGPNVFEFNLSTSK